jgi:hypothetical protein
MAADTNNSVYQINKGINAAIQFKGLQAQYIWYLGGAAVILMTTYALLYVSGVNSFTCVGAVIALGIPIILTIYHLSSTYGAHGLSKALAKRSIPQTVKSNSRMVFTKLNKDTNAKATR